MKETNQVILIPSIGSQHVKVFINKCSSDHTKNFSSGYELQIISFTMLSEILNYVEQATQSMKETILVVFTASLSSQKKIINKQLKRRKLETFRVTLTA